MKLEFKIDKFDVPDLEQYEHDLCNALVDRVKLRTPERTGTLKRSITGTVGQNEIVLSSDVDYASHVEYGTINMAGHAMFRMAIEDGPQIAANIEIKDKKN